VLLALKIPGRLTAFTELQRSLADRGLTVLASLVGAPVFGPEGAEAELARLVALARHPGVKHLAFDPARIVAGATDFSIEQDVSLAAARIRPVLDAALEHGVELLVSPRDTVWARHLPDFLTRALADTALDRLKIGVRLFAELPESWESYSTLHRFARRRVADGGAPLDVVLGFSSAAACERVRSVLSGLAVPV